MIDLSSSASTVDSRCYCHCVISYQKKINQHTTHETLDHACAVAQASNNKLL